MHHDTHFDPTLVRQTIRLAEEMEITRLAGKGGLPAARERFVEWIENLTTREIYMLEGVRVVGAKEATDLEAAIEAVAARHASKPALGMAMADDESLVKHLGDGLAELLVKSPEV